MQGRGLNVGTSRVGWREYTPQLDVYNSQTTTPTLGAGATQFGRYLYLPEQKLCLCDFEIGFGSSPSPGNGTYIVSLPVPMQRAWGQNANLNADRPVGSGWALKGITAPAIPLSWIASDAPGLTYNGPQEQWVQALLPYNYVSGSSSIPTTAASVAVSFPFTLPVAPAASDIIVVPTASGAGPTGTASIPVTAASVAVSYPHTMASAPGPQDITIVPTSGAPIGASGTATITTGNTSVAVSFTNALTNSPLNAADLVVVMTAAETSGTGRGFWISGFTTSGFTINVPVATAANVTFDWQVRIGGPYVTATSTSGFTLALSNNPGSSYSFSYRVNPASPFWVTSVSTAGFTVNLPNNPNGSWGFNWKLFGSTLGPVLLQANSGWGIGNTVLDRIAGSLVYETLA